ATTRTRAVVDAVRELQGAKPVRITAVAERLGINAMAAHRRVNAAIRAGYLVNRETRLRQPADLDLGEPLPPDDGLPRPDELSVNTLTGSTDANSDSPASTEADSPMAAMGDRGAAIIGEACERGNAQAVTGVCVQCGGP